MAAWWHIRLVVCTFALCALWKVCAADEDHPVVHVDEGTVEGERITFEDKELDAFYSIPYAEPPIGELRFEKPKPKKPWKGTLSATSKPPPCPQVELIFANNIAFNYSYASEDCLYINVLRSPCSDAKPCSNRPVVIFVHGGAFQWADSSLFYFDTINFAASTGTIVVSFNYRVGVLGFFSTESSDVPGNMGLWDQLLAMKWVKKNIAKFGGNSEDITLYGQSAGAMSAGLHSLVPHSKGLFKRVIMQSGTALSTLMMNSYTGVSRVINFASNLGCYDNDRAWSEQVSSVVACMKKVDASDIIAKLRELKYTQQIYAPRVDGDFMSAHPIEMDPLKISSMEIFAGTCLNEGTLLVENLRYVSPELLSSLAEDYRTGATLATAVIFDIPLGASKKIVQAYYGGYEVEHSFQEVLNILSEMIGDAVFDCPTNYFLMKAAEQGIATYRYVFAHRPSHSFWPKWLGATHGDDVSYTLGSLPLMKEAVTNPESEWRSLAERLNATDFDYTPDEEELMHQLIGTWNSFAVNGKPKIPDTDQDWPKYSEKSPDFIYLQPHNFTKGIGPKLDRCELWKPYLLRQKTTVNTTPKPKPTPRRKPTHSRKPPKQQMDDNTIAGGSVSFGDSTILLTTLAILAKLTL
ncbi:acetylcholinesterase-1-like isoform X2 [Ornithodoros turicata]|uniref:acetylcholinesterase-1-like isoform X2 n=1 Tax=Ornithodoros turicata TaxID=34597 RepID=UPI0031388A69